jgi:hypothetical protein
MIDHLLNPEWLDASDERFVETCLSVLFHGVAAPDPMRSLAGLLLALPLACGGRKENRPQSPPLHRRAPKPRQPPARGAERVETARLNAPPASGSIEAPASPRSARRCRAGSWPCS